MVRDSPEEWHRFADVVVVGSGTGLVAALTAAIDGADVLVLEKAPVVGGTTAVSDAGIWIPNARPVVEAAGRTPREELTAYIQRAAGDRAPDESIHAFLDTGPEVVEFIEEHTALAFEYGGMPDYHVEWDGGSKEGHQVSPTLFDGNRLEDRLDDVRENPHEPYPVTKSEIHEAGGRVKCLSELDTGTLEARRDRNVLNGGRALVAGLYEGCLDAGVTFELSAPAKELVVDGDGERGERGQGRREGQKRGQGRERGRRVVGIVAEIDGEDVSVRADAVVVAAGGMEWDADMHENFLRGPMDAPASPPYNEGDGIELGMDIGAKLGNTNEAWWCPTMHVPGEEWETGDPLYRMVYAERSLPGSIMVNADGERFVNEAGNYHDVAKTFHWFDPDAYDYRNLPAYLVFDDRFRREYVLMRVLRPDDPDPDWLTSADTLASLAGRIGVDPDGLTDTVRAFNEHAAEGRDPAFGRGTDYYDRHLGDADADHPNLRPLTEPPFYAFEVLSGGFGTKGGLVTTPDARVVDTREEPIPGLYAASNCTAHIMGIGYAGAGVTLGPNLVFAYLAGDRASS